MSANGAMAPCSWILLVLMSSVGAISAYEFFMSAQEGPLVLINAYECAWHHNHACSWLLMNINEHSWALISSYGHSWAWRHCANSTHERLWPFMSLAPFHITTHSAFAPYLSFLVAKQLYIQSCLSVCLSVCLRVPPKFLSRILKSIQCT